MKRLLFYIAGPISAPTKAQEHENVRMAERAMYAIIKAGHHAICPHLDWFAQRDKWGHNEKVTVHYGEMLRNDVAMLVRCDAVLRLPGDSPGAELETFTASLRDLPVVHSLGEALELGKKVNKTVQWPTLRPTEAE